MFAFLVWAGSLCLDLGKVGPGELEYEISKLKLHLKYSSSRKAEEKKVKRVLRAFVDKGLIRGDCLELFEFLAGEECNWTQPELRWSCEEAVHAISGRFKCTVNEGKQERMRESRAHCLSPSSGLRSLSLSKENNSTIAKQKGVRRARKPLALITNAH